jgi:hypothetical protein
MDERRPDDEARQAPGADKTPNRRRFVRTAGAMTLIAAGGMLLPARAGAAEVADAACPSPGGTSGFGRKRFAQTFVAKHSGLLTRVTVQATLAADASDDYRVQIRRVNRKGKPTATVLAETVVSDVADPPNGQTTTVTATFAPGAAVKKGRRYALVLEGVDGDTPIVHVSFPDKLCRGGMFEDDDLDGAFVKNAGADVVFEAFVTKP